MAAHRYWRARNLVAYDRGAAVDLSEFWLLAAGVRVDGAATLTSTIAPLAGSLAALQDDDIDTVCALSTATVLTWDFGGSPAGVDDIRLGSAGGRQKFLMICVIEWSDDAAAWTTYRWHEPTQAPVLFAWPGAHALTTSKDPNGWDGGSLLQYTLHPTDGRIISTTGNVGRYASAEAYAQQGVRQFEMTKSTWASAFLSTGVVRQGGSITNPDGATGWGIYLSSNEKSDIGTPLRVAWPASGPWLASDVLGVVIDFDVGTLTAYKNGVSIGVVFNSLAGETVRPATNAGSGSDTTVLRTNDFAYPIAGADPWTKARIAPGFLTHSPTLAAISNGGFDEPHADNFGVALSRARPDLHFDPAARGRIVGTVKRDADPANIPLRRRVRLYRDRDGMFIREGWSDAAGNYQFDYIEEWEAYTVIANDYEFFYRAVVADNLTLANGGVELI